MKYESLEPLTHEQAEALATPLPAEDGKTVCDVLALRRDGGRSSPVLLELKDERQLTRLVEQVEGYAALVDAHAELFAQLFGALLGEGVPFDRPTEKWTSGRQPGQRRTRAKPSSSRGRYVSSDTRNVDPGPTPYAWGEE
jgi:hypothetical protein